MDVVLIYCIMFLRVFPAFSRDAATRRRRPGGLHNKEAFAFSGATGRAAAGTNDKEGPYERGRGGSQVTVSSITSSGKGNDSTSGSIRSSTMPVAARWYHWKHLGPGAAPVAVPIAVQQ